MACLRLHSVSRTFASGVAAVRDVSMSFAENELVAVVGESGCGKTTLLRLLAGLDEPTSGSIEYISSGHSSSVPNSDVLLVAQDPAFYPHLTIRRNLAMAAASCSLSKSALRERIAEASASFRISELLDRMPETLSGGQLQRVALARVLVRRPRVVLLDEPLSHVDVQLRDALRATLMKRQQDWNPIMIWVTHDHDEAMIVGDRIVVLRDGLVLQSGTRHELFSSPASIHVASIIGRPVINVLSLNILGSGEGADVAIAGEMTNLRLCANTEIEPRSSFVAGIRPTDLQLLSCDTNLPADLQFEGTVCRFDWFGSEAVMVLQLADGSTMRCQVAPDCAHQIGDRVRLGCDSQDVLIFDDGASGMRIPVELALKQ